MHTKRGQFKAIIGEYFSEHPAWKTMEAQMTAKFRGWNPLVALQLEYSLLERTIEGELVPLAIEHGLGVTPWSPLKSGVLTGKYTRSNAGKIESSRGAWATSALDDKGYTVIDALIKIAKEVDSTPARVALSWVQNRSGFNSTIIGARTIQQLEDNLAGLALKLKPAQTEPLTNLTEPKLNFPADFGKHSGPFGNSGTTINRKFSEVNPLAPGTDAERF